MIRNPFLYACAQQSQLTIQSMQIATAIAQAKPTLKLTETVFSRSGSKYHFCRKLFKVICHLHCVDYSYVTAKVSAPDVVKVLLCSWSFAGCLAFNEDHPATRQRDDPVRHRPAPWAGKLLARSAKRLDALDQCGFNRSFKDC
jgi:hypothetical protein